MKRNPYADVGLTVSIAVLICLIVKSLLFGLTVAGIIWMTLCLAYLVVSKLYPSDGRVVKMSTHAFLVLSVVGFASIVAFDTNARPKMHAFAGALTDTLEEEPEFVVDEQPTIWVDTTSVDTLDTDSDAMAVLLDSLVEMMPVEEPSDNEEELQTTE